MRKALRNPGEEQSGLCQKRNNKKGRTETESSFLLLDGIREDFSSFMAQMKLSQQETVTISEIKSLKKSVVAERQSNWGRVKDFCGLSPTADVHHQIPGNLSGNTEGWSFKTTRKNSKSSITVNRFWRQVLTQNWTAFICLLASSCLIRHVMYFFRH